MKSIRTFLVSLVVAILFGVCAPRIMAQTASTGALTGTVTDHSGAVIVGAKVMAVNLATGQTRTVTTNSKGSYQISLLPPGEYSVHFEAQGFKSADVPMIRVNVTETPTLNRSLQIGTTTQKVVVQENTQMIQTTNVTNGTVVSGHEITSLPLVSRNYTQILDLSPGVVTNVANSAAVGNGTQDVSVNGLPGNQNNYSMDGADVVPYTSGMAEQGNAFAGIPIPNPDTIEEFKVQTSQYDASYGRNPGANVEVITKGGSNHFHGDVFEFNRNNFFNANDFFYKQSEMQQNLPNKPQILKQNTFGFTLGGPIKKNKIFFFGSYQGFRQINGIGTVGISTGYEAATTLLPWNDYNYKTDGLGCTDIRCTNDPAAYRKYLGSVFGPVNPTISCPQAFTSLTATNNCNTGYQDGVTIDQNGDQITNTAIALLQAKGIINGGYNQGFYFPAAPQGCQLADPSQPSSGCNIAMSIPTRANENEYMMNSDWLISPKNTLEERYMYESDPQVVSFLCLYTPNSCNPGSPYDITDINHVGTLRLTSVLGNNLLNDARFTFFRNLQEAQNPNTLQACGLPNGASIIPLANNGQPCPAVASGEFAKVPTIDVYGDSQRNGGSADYYSPSGGWGQGANTMALSTNIVDEFQVADQISWNHGIHSFHVGFDAEWDQYNNNSVDSGRAEEQFLNIADFLTSSSGPAIDGTPATGPAATGGVPTTGCGFRGNSICQAGMFRGVGLRGLLTHYNRANSFDWFVQDDIKINSRLTVNAGLRWEYDGYPSDKIGQFTNIWPSQLATVNTGSYFLNDAATTNCNGFPVGTLAGYVVPSNFDRTAGLTGPCGSTGVIVNNNNTLLSGTPLDNFAPRLGVAWQPFGHKFVVRAGYGWFYDRIYTTYLIDGQLNVPPYSGTVNGTIPASYSNTLHFPFYSVAGVPLTWTPRYLYFPGTFDPNAYNPTGSVQYSGLTYTANSNTLAQRLPLTQEYSLDLQYQISPAWLVDVGYDGMHTIHAFNARQPINVARLVDCGVPSATCNAPTEPQDKAMVVNAAQPLNMPNGNLSYIPFNDPANTTPITINTTQNLPARVPYLGYTAGALGSSTTIGDALYNSLQAQVRHTFSHGLMLQASYTWSKDLTNINSSESAANSGQTLFGTSGSNNPLDLAQQYGLASFNRSQRLIVSYSYDIPWKSTAGFSGHLLSGWTLSGVTTLQNGQPFTVTDSGGGSIYGASASRGLLADPVDCGSNGVCKSGIPVGLPGSTTARVLSGSWINGAAFTPFSTITASSPYCIGGAANPSGSASATCGATRVTPSTFEVAGTGWGNAPVGILTGPGQWNWDMSLQKNTKITEGTTLQFRAEFYNIWNHPQFNNPVSTAVVSPATGTGSGPNFGPIKTTSVTPRVIQFGLKFLF